MDAYLLRPSFHVALFLFDSRRGLDAEDINVCDLIARNAKLVVVPTKIDKLKAPQRQKIDSVVRDALQARGIAPELIQSVSSLKKQGITQLQETILTLI